MKKERLLIIEDELSVAKQLKWSLGPDYDITIAADTQSARQQLVSGAFSVATLDLGLPPYPDTPEVGLALLEELADLSITTKIIVITGNGEQKNALKAVSLGAVDFCVKPIDLEMLKVILVRTYKMHCLEAINRQLEKQMDEGGVLCDMIGFSSAMQKVFRLIRKVSDNDYPVLITGPSGTGKEIAAQAVHRLSPRSSRSMIIVNCGAIPENLIESELFGHEKGAFTGATERKKGKFELADGGTIFLDEIGELPLSMQVKLLRCLQEGTIDRVGGTRTIELNVRIIAATNTNLEQAVADRTFREDLYFRLDVVPIKLPPLTDRPEDILVLAQHFLTVEARSLKKPRIGLSVSAMAAIAAHNWPGNVRELQNRIRRAMTISNGKIITPVDLGLDSDKMNQEVQAMTTLKEARDEAERSCVQKALLITGNNISQAAKILDVSRPTIHDLIKKHKLADQ